MTINIGRYVPELTAMYASYRYSKAVFRNQKLRSQIAEQEFKDLFAAALPFLKDSANPKDVESQFRDKIHEQVVENIDLGLAVLRTQLLEAAHSIFEKFLCHVVRVYLNTFPEILVVVEINCLLFLRTFFPLIMVNASNNRMLCHKETAVHAS